jgi:hypothetical protein
VAVVEEHLLRHSQMAVTVAAEAEAAARLPLHLPLHPQVAAAMAAEAAVAPL